MQRVSIFFFLTLIVPSAIYWASHGFESPGRGLKRFAREVHALAGARPAPAPSKPTEPESKPQKKTEEQEKTEKTEKPKPKVEVKKDPGVSRIEQAQSHFDAGRFREAADAFGGLDERMQALAGLGAALARAFPANLPGGPYYVVTTNSGVEHEGFATERSDMLRLVIPGAPPLPLPTNVISSKRKLDRPKAIERLARRVTAEGTSPKLKGPRLFVLLRRALRMDRPDVAAPLLERVLELDEAKPFFLSAVRNKVAPEYQEDLYRAIGRCAVVEDDGPDHDTVSTHAPKKLGDGTVARKPRRSKTTIRSKDALALVKKAAPHRTEGAKLHKQTVQAGLAGASLVSINKAVREFEKAMGYYEKALEHEDSNEIHALLQYCSRRAFQLRFWREQIEGK